MPFWPDMAIFHYTKGVMDYLKQQKITFISTSENVSNVPQARCTERFEFYEKRNIQNVLLRRKVLLDFKCLK